MFTTKKTKETLDKVQQLEEVKQEYDSFLDTVKETKTMSDEAFAGMQDGEVHLGKMIGDLAESLQEQCVACGHLYDKTAAMFSKMEEISLANTKANDGEEVLAQQVEKVKKVAEYTGDIEKQCEKIGELEDKEEAEWEQQFSENAAQLDVMQEAARNMTVLALNAAIEAGRLGGAGRGFLKAAEDVRELSEEYSQMLGHLAGQFEKMKQMNERNKEARRRIVTELTKYVSSAAEWKEEISTMESDIRQSERVPILMKEQQENTKSVADGFRETCERYEDIQSKMDILAQKSAANRQMREELEQQLARVYGRIIK